jgi:replicative DNA helicase
MSNTQDSSRDQFLERPLPNSSESERAILGSIVLDNGLISHALEQLKPEDFYVPSHRRIFVSMMSLFERGSEINPILIGEELRRDGSLESVGGISFITTLTYGLPHFANIAHYSKIVKDKAVLRKLYKECARIISELQEEEEEATVIVGNAVNGVFTINDELNADQKEDFTSAHVLVTENITRAHHIQETGSTLTGLSTGFYDIDSKTLGLQRTDLIIIAGRPSVGKTTLGLNIAQNAAFRGDAHVAVFSLEMSKSQLGDRIICSEARLDSLRFRSGYINQEEWSRIDAVPNLTLFSKLHIDDTPGLNTIQLRSKAMRLVTEQGPLDLIVVDYLQLMSGSARRSESRQQDVTQISNDLKGIAKELNVPLIALSQLSRAPEGRVDKRPILSDLRESGSIEQSADIVAFVYREDYYRKKSTPEEIAPLDGMAELIIGKHRNGPTGTVLLRFEESITRFDNLSTD